MRVGPTEGSMQPMHVRSAPQEKAATKAKLAERLRRMQRITDTLRETDAWMRPNRRDLHRGEGEGAGRPRGFG